MPVEFSAIGLVIRNRVNISEAHFLSEVLPTRLPYFPLNGLTSQTWNAFRYFGRTLWTGDQPIARPPSSQDSRTQKNTDTHP
jgi:hypothetical protein